MALPLRGIRVLVVAVNVPALAAGFRLAELGASVTKVEPPDGDPTGAASPELYARLTAGHEVVRLDLKTDRAPLDPYLADADVLITSSRPSALARLGLAWSDLEERYPRLVQVAIVGHAEPEPRSERGHVDRHDEHTDPAERQGHRAGSSQDRLYCGGPAAGRTVALFESPYPSVQTIVSGLPGETWSMTRWRSVPELIVRPPATVIWSPGWMPA